MPMSAAPLQVDFLPDAALRARGRLGLTCAPGLWWPSRGSHSDLLLRDDLANLVHAHVATVLVTLLEQPEIAALGDLRREARRAGLTWVHFPIPDMWIPADVPATRKLVERILRSLEGGDDVIVHCWAGLGRTGTIAAACLITRGMAPTAAMETVRVARDGAIQSQAQEQFVLGFTAREPG